MTKLKIVYPIIIKDLFGLSPIFDMTELNKMPYIIEHITRVKKLGSKNPVIESTYL